MNEATLKLSDLGERRLISDILPKYTTGIGDDCAFLNAPGNQIVVTTDPVPVPAAKLIGGDPDLYWMGRLLVTINSSDLAASGATPLGFLSAIEAPSTLELQEFERLLLGIRDACAYEGLSYVGGNLRESSVVGAVGTAIGCLKGKALRRTGASVGDVIVSIGAGGIFWRDALQLLQGGIYIEKEHSPVFNPHSQLKSMSALSELGSLNATIDNSDGLLPSLELLSRANNTWVELDLDKLTVPSAENLVGIDQARLWLGWGDWNVVAAVGREYLREIQEVALSQGSSVTAIGSFINKPGCRVLLKRGQLSVPAPRLESERFVRDSWFTGGIKKYIDALLSAELP